jgi:hypothetical protein
MVANSTTYQSRKPLMQFTQSVWLFSRNVLFAFAILTIAAYLWQGYYEGNWWSAGYVYTMLPVIAALPVITWFAFVPKTLEFSEELFTVQFHFRPRHRIPWGELKYWGWGENVFLLEFEGHRTFQIALWAFPSNQRRPLIDFLSAHYPKRKARLWIGIQGFRW